MHQLHTPTRFRRFVSTLLSLALVASLAPTFAPAVAAADPSASEADVVALDSAASTSTLDATGTVGANGWYKSNVEATITAVPTNDTTISVGITGANARTFTSYPASSTVRLASLTQEGTATLSYYSAHTTDAPGEHETTHTIDIKIDKTSPVTTATASPSRVTSLTAAVTVSAVNTVSGLDKLWYRVGASGSVVETTQASVLATTVAGVGTTTIWVWSIDKAGNQDATKTLDVLIDKTLPVTTSNRVASYVNTATITLMPTDAGGAGMKSTFYNLDNTGIKMGTSVVATSSTTTTHTLTFWSSDNAGNVESNAAASNTVTFTINGDTAAPITTLVTKPGLVLANWQSTVVTFSLTATDQPTGANVGVAATYYRLDSTPTVTYTPSSVVTINKEGTTLLEFWSVDAVGAKETTHTQPVMIDTVKPTSSNNGVAEYAESAAISVSATDTTSGIASITYRIDNGTWTLAPGITPGSPTANATLPSVFTAGNHTIEYLVADRAGNQDATGTANFHVTREPAFVLASRVVFMNNTVSPASILVTTHLMDGTTPLAGKRVVLQYSTSPTFAGARSVVGTTTALGWVRLGFKATGRVYVRYLFAGDADYGDAVSNKVAYIPKVALTMPTAASRQTAGRAFTVTGKIYPVHKAGTKIKIERYLMVRGKRVYRGYVWAKVPARNRYSFAARLTLSRGTWQLRAIAPYDVTHNTTTSGFKTIVVR